jgi:addiction module HigA family antidote
MSRRRTHPGEVLAEEYLTPLGMSAAALGRAIDVPPNRISDLIRGHRQVTADTALRLARFFDTDPRFWLNLQDAYNLSVAEDDHDYSGIRTLEHA